MKGEQTSNQTLLTVADERAQIVFVPAKIVVVIPVWDRCTDFEGRQKKREE